MFATNKVYNNIKIKKKFIKLLKSINHLVKKSLRLMDNIISLIQFWKIKAYWYEEKKIKNFGDMLNPFFIREITNKKVKRINKNYWKKHFIICGSIIKDINSKSVVWGAGIMTAKEVFKKPKKILAVRGPLTRKRFIELGYKCPKSYGDPALLLPIFHKIKENKKYKFGIIPHFIDYKKIEKITETNKDILIIDLLENVTKVIEEINQCEYIISSSLHGLIVPHAYNIPAIWVEFSNNLKGDGIKFNDYFYSVEIKPYSPINLINYQFLNNTIIEDIFKKNGKVENIPKKEKIKEIQKNLINSCPLKIKDRHNLIKQINEI